MPYLQGIAFYLQRGIVHLTGSASAGKDIHESVSGSGRCYLLLRDHDPAFEHSHLCHIGKVDTVYLGAVGLVNPDKPGGAEYRSAVELYGNRRIHAHRIGRRRIFPGRTEGCRLNRFAIITLERTGLCAYPEKVGRTLPEPRDFDVTTGCGANSGNLSAFFLIELPVVTFRTFNFLPLEDQRSFGGIVKRNAAGNTKGIARLLLFPLAATQYGKRKQHQQKSFH